MTDKEAMKLALDALENQMTYVYDTESNASKKCLPAITALKERLAQEKALQVLHSENERLGLYKNAYAEPVAWGVFEGNLHDMFFTQEEAQEMAKLKGTHAEVRPFYTHPPQRTWVGLTDEEMHECAGEYPWTPTGLKCVRAIEAKLKQKNGYAEEKNT